MRPLLILLFFTLSLLAKPTFTISLVTDGDTDYSKAFETALKTEITQLLSRDFDVRFPKSEYYNGQWNYLKIADNVQKALRSPHSDLVLTVGALSSHYAARQSSYGKPVIATAIINPKMQRIPNRKGRSGKRNLTYVDAHASLDSDIETIKSTFHPSHVAVIVNDILLTNAPQIGDYIAKKFAENNITATIVGTKATPEATLAQLDDSVDFVYVTPLFQHDKSYRKQLYDILRLKELPSFSAEGRDDVELGALIGIMPAADVKRFIRQIALDVQQIALGTPASQLPVDFVPYPAISINARTAKEVGFTPSWDLLSNAAIVEADTSDAYPFSVEEIMDRAVHHNLRVLASGHEIDRQRSEVRKAKATYLPQLHLGGEAASIDQDRATASLGLFNETRLDAYVTFSQQIYNQRALALISVNEHFLDAKTSSNDYVKLDTALQAGLGTLRIMRLQTNLQLQKQNLELTRKNLRSAITQKNIGIGNPADIFRWQSKLALDKRAVIEAHAALKQARNDLNALLDLPQDLPLNFKAIDIDDPIFMTSREAMLSYFVDPKKFSAFMNYLVATGRKNMPSLHQIAALRDAKKTIMESNKKAIYQPDLSLEGGLRQHFVSSSNDVRDSDPNLKKYPYADNTDWEVGLYLRFPLYVGGRNQAEYEAAKAELLAVESRRDDLYNLVERDIRNAFYQAKASYLSIELAKAAAESAEQNLRVVRNIYSQGNLPVVTLLDAQSNALRSKLEEISARYGFMSDLLVLQHHIGQVNFDMRDEDWQQWYAPLQAAEGADE